MMTGWMNRGIIAHTMEVTFHDPTEAPLPPRETHIIALRAEPWSDARRVGVEIEITPFQQRPNLHVAIFDGSGAEVAAVGAMQIRQKQIGFTIHLRQPDTSGRYTVSAYLAYADPEIGVVDEAQTTFEIS
jgi:hypothetical protein